MTKLSDVPEVIRLAKKYKRVKEAIEIGDDYILTVQGNLVANVPNAKAITFLETIKAETSAALNALGVDADV